MLADKIEVITAVVITAVMIAADGIIDKHHIIYHLAWLYSSWPPWNIITIPLHITVPVEPTHGCLLPDDLKVNRCASLQYGTVFFSDTLKTFSLKSESDFFGVRDQKRNTICPPPERI